MGRIQSKKTRSEARKPTRGPRAIVAWFLTDENYGKEKDYARLCLGAWRRKIRISKL